MEMVEVSAAARQGDSGGPILNDRGELAGVLFGSASGTTSGSYCGRVRWFLDPLWPELGQPPSAALADVASDHQTPTASESRDSLVNISEVPVAIVSPEKADARGPANNRTQAFGAFSQSNTDSSGLANDLQAWAQPVDRSAREPASDWRNLAGETLFEQVKSVLAGIGLLVVLLQLSRFVFPAKPAEEDE
jgi:hypothetical protein